MLCWEPSRKLFCELAQENVFFAKVCESWILWIIIIVITACWLPPPARGSSQLPKVRLRRQIPWSWSTSLHLPLVQRCFLKSQETSSKCSSQASKSEALQEPNTKALVFAFPLMRPLLMAGVCGLGYFRESFAKVLRRSVRKSKRIWKGVAQ